MRTFFAWRDVGALSVAVVALSLAGCFADPDLSEISCKTDKQCAPGYQCDLSRNKCRVGGDAGATAEAGSASVDSAFDLGQHVDGSAVLDASAAVDAGLDADDILTDGPTWDVMAPVDSPNFVPDVAMDLATDLRGDLSNGLPDASRDSLADAFPDALHDAAATDLPLAADVGTTGLPLGSTCSHPSDCAVGNCVDGVCCSSACTGSCQSCALADSRGTCSYVTGTPATGHGSCSGSGTCGGTCAGNSASCVYPGTDTSCGSASCSGGSATSAGSCNGAGTCSPGQTSICGAYGCGATACLTSCTTNSQCAAGAACVAGVCTKCAAGQTACEGACLDVQNSNNHCGSCTAAACASGEQCKGGKCLLQDGRPCTAPGQCASGVCPLFYLDSDNDGFPVQSSGKGYCNVNSAPGATYTYARSDDRWDCYDADATVNPGVTDYFDSANANYGWDWDCSGAVEKKTMDIATCLPNATNDNCVPGQTTGTPSENCGDIHVLPGCATTSTNPLTCLLFSGSNGGTVLCH